MITCACCEQLAAPGRAISQQCRRCGLLYFACCNADRLPTCGDGGKRHALVPLDGERVQRGEYPISRAAGATNGRAGGLAAAARRPANIIGTLTGYSLADFVPATHITPTPVSTLDRPLDRGVNRGQPVADQRRKRLHLHTPICYNPL